MALTKTTQRMLSGGVINVLDYGADPTGSADSSSAIQAAINAAKTTQQIVYVPAGIYSMASQVTFSDSPVSLVGEREAVWRSGSDRPSVLLRWTGGATSMFHTTISNVSFEGISVENRGTATDFFSIADGGIRYRFHRMSFLKASGTTAFSRSIIYSFGHSVGYSTFSSIQMGGGKAPKFLFIDGQSDINGVTPIRFSDRCIFESGAGANLDVIHADDCRIDYVIIEDCTFNQQGGELRVLYTPNPRSTSIQGISFHNNEWDYSIANDANDRIMQLENAQNISIRGNHFQCGGTPATAFALTNCTVADCSGNYIKSIPTFITADSESFVNIGYNDVDVSNVGRILNDSAYGYYAPTWASGNNFYNLQNLPSNRHGIVLVDVTANAAWNIGLRNGSSGFSTSGQMFSLMIKNTSGGAITAPSLSSNIKVPAALVMPADGNSRTYTFFLDNGGNAIEIYRSAADVPNP
jgi:hypothetical protein